MPNGQIAPDKQVQPTLFSSSVISQEPASTQMELPFCQMTPKMLSEPPWMKSFLSIFSCLVSLLTAMVKWLSSAFNKPWSHTSLLVDVCECVCVSVVNDLVVYLETSLHPQLGKLTLLLTLGDTIRVPLMSPHSYLFSVQLWTSHCQDMYFFAWGLSLNTWLNTWELTALIHPHTHLSPQPVTDVYIWYINTLALSSFTWDHSD